MTPATDCSWPWPLGCEYALREADTIGRMGGDEFVVLIDGASLEAAPELVAERLLDVMRQPFELAGATRCRSSST